MAGYGFGDGIESCSISVDILSVLAYWSLGREHRTAATSFMWIKLILQGQYRIDIAYKYIS